MAYLSVKLDHVAVLREARRNKTPDLSRATVLAELAGADGIAVHLRGDLRHVRDRDLYILREVVRTRLTVETTVTEEHIDRLLEVKPYLVMFVPEVDKEITTQSGHGPNDEYDLYGQRGGYERLMDKNAVKRPCSVCGEEVQKIQYLGGACYFCNHCQV